MVDTLNCSLSEPQPTLYISHKNHHIILGERVHETLPIPAKSIAYIFTLIYYT